MTNLNELAAAWNAIYNGSLGLDPVFSYLLTNALRVLVAWSALLMVRAVARWARLAFPPPYTPDNLAYWLRYWLWLRLLQYPLLKVCAVLLALLLVLQIPAGLDAPLATASPYVVLAYLVLIGVFVGISQVLNSLARQIKHPEVSSGPR